MKGSPCCAGLMRSCCHTPAKYRGGHQPSMGGSSTNYGGVISQVWGGHQPTMGGVINQLWRGSSTNYGGGHQPSMGGHQPTMGGHQPTTGGGHQPSMGGSHQPTMGGPISQVGGGIFPPVCTGSQNRENYFSNTYVLPSVNRTAGPNRLKLHRQLQQPSALNKAVPLLNTCRLYFPNITER